MAKLILLRHGESTYNKENLFTGWTDVELTAHGRQEARNVGKILQKDALFPDICFTSYLKRAIHTLELLLQEMRHEHMDCIKSWKLNERHYGTWQEHNKNDIKKEVGQKQFVAVRRGYDTPPPPLRDDDPRVAQNDPKYKYVNLSSLPKSESLKDTRDRTLNYYYQEIVPKLCLGKTVLISAHGNSLRSLVMEIESLSPKEIVKVEILTAEPIVYIFDKTMNLI